MILNDEIPWREAITKADSFLAIGQNRVYLSGDNTADYPWEFVTEITPGSSHRMDISTDASFTAKHPSGLRFCWSFSIEPRSANGKGHYEIDIEGCHRVLGLLTPTVRAQFQSYLQSCAAAIRKHAIEGKTWVDRELATAEALERAALR